MSKEELLKLIQKSIADMEKKGYKLGGAGIINLGASNEKFEEVKKDFQEILDYVTKPVSKEESLKEDSKQSLPDFILDILSGKKEETKKKCDDENCPTLEGELCENCSAFENFEKDFGVKGSIFDEAYVVLNNRVFHIKYLLNPDGHEDIMIYPRSGNGLYKGYSLSALEEELNKAVKDKKYDEAQKILDIINENFKK